MAGPAALTIAAMQVILFLILACVFLHWWYNMGGMEAFSRLII